MSSDSTNDIHEYNRNLWTLADLRQIVTDCSALDGASVVKLTAPEPQSQRGTIAVVVAE